MFILPVQHELLILEISVTSLSMLTVDHNEQK